MTEDDLLNDLNRLLRDGLAAVDHSDDVGLRFRITPRGVDELHEQTRLALADSQVDARFPVTTRTDLHVNTRRLDRGPS